MEIAPLTHKESCFIETLMSMQLVAVVREICIQRGYNGQTGRAHVEKLVREILVNEILKTWN